MVPGLTTSEEVLNILEKIPATEQNHLWVHKADLNNFINQTITFSFDEKRNAFFSPTAP